MRSYRARRPWWIVCVALFPAPPGAVADPAAVAPFFTSSEVRTMEVPSDRAARSTRLGRVAPDVLRNDRLRLDLPDGRRYVAERDVRRSNDTLWIGSIDGVERSAVWLTHEHGVVVGLMRVDGDTFEVTPIWTGEVLLYGIGTEGRPPYSDLAGRVHLAEHEAPQPKWPTGDRAPRRVVALYTPAARTHWADSGGIEARIITGIAAANGTHAGPWVLDEVREVDYAESGDARDALRWLQRYVASVGERSPSTGNASAVRAVLLITEDNNLCGVTTKPQPMQTRRVELHAIYSSCLSDPSLAAQLDGAGGGERQAFVE